MSRVRDAYDPEIRERAVENVDRRHGYTMEFALSPAQHRDEYDREEDRLHEERAAQQRMERDRVIIDPGLLICQHPNRIHYLGGGMRVCFECMAKLIA